MITLSPCVLKHHKKMDGTYNVKIRVTFDRKTVYIPTTLYCRKSDLNTKGKLKTGAMLWQCEQLVQKMREAVSDLTIIELEGRDVWWVVDYIKDKMRGNQFRLDFFTWADGYILTKTESTRRAYTSALNALERFVGKRELDINDITHTMMTQFMEYIDAEPKMAWDTGKKAVVPSSKARMSKGTSTRHIMKLANIFKAAKRKYNDDDAGKILIPRNPFDRLEKVFPPSKGQDSIGLETMQKVISAQTDDRQERMALDAFVISFGLMGANMADLYFASPVKDVWIYNRQKTAARRADNAEMQVAVPAELSDYIGRMQDGPKGWWLPLLHKAAGRKDLATQKVNVGLARWCDRNKVQRFTFYAARHTWASLARSKDVGIEKATVDECLGHIGDYQMADIYAERDWSLMAEANRKVLALFKW